MMISSKEWDIDLDLVDILIKREKKEQKSDQQRPFLQIPAPEPPHLPPKQQKTEKKKNNDGAIVIDI